MALSKEMYDQLLVGLGFKKTHSTNYIHEYTDSEREEVVYVHLKAPIGIVIHPEYDHIHQTLSKMISVEHKPGKKTHYKPGSNFRGFPKLIFTKDPIHYGLKYEILTEEALRIFVEFLRSEGQNNNIYFEIESEQNSLSKKIDTQRQAQVLARVGQGPWRRKLDIFWGYCALTGCDIRQMLRGSHIKPWRYSNDIERVDVHNGLLLRADVDALFDKGLITFHDDGAASVSSILTPNQIDSLPFDMTLKIRGLSNESKRYMEYHRENVWRN